MGSKALIQAVEMHAAPEGIGSLREGLGIHGTRDSDEDKLLKIFRGADVDGNGSISKLELSAVLRTLDSNLSYDAIDAMFTAADANNDGGIEYEEFVSWLFRGAEQPETEPDNPFMPSSVGCWKL